jgi:para-nitrobenzyl esterase
MSAETVRVREGALRGARSGDGLVHIYRGVPYARPPIGDLRWRPPQPAAPWEGSRAAEAFAPHAVQPPIRDAIAGGAYGATSEDCLYLNVWTTAPSREERRPVMVWFHHGAFRFGGPGIPAYDGEHLARNGAVVVSVAYRLGLLGFMGHPELTAESPNAASSNYGLMDQIAALRWVQENIAAFGGDRDCVTIFGLSAGSASVNLLMASPLAKGLFHRAIGQSGALMSAAEPTVGYADMLQSLEGAEETGARVARALGCSSIDELRRRPAGDLVAVAPEQLLAPEALETPWRRGGHPVAHGSLDGSYPVVDGYVLPRTPFEIFRDGEQSDVPLLTGSSVRESSNLPSIPLVEDWVRLVHAEYGDDADRVLSLYPATPEDVQEVSASIRGDRVFIWQNWEWVRQHVRSASSAGFYYHWSYVPPIAAPEEFSAIMRGAYHGVELPYVFGNLDAMDWPWRDYDRELRDTVTRCWLGFAATGDPNGAHVPQWRAFDLEAPQAMHFGEAVGMGPVPRRAQMDFWDDWYGALRAAASAS